MKCLGCNQNYDDKYEHCPECYMTGENKKLFSLKGRITRKTFWKHQVLCLSLITLAIFTFRLNLGFFHIIFTLVPFVIGFIFMLSSFNKRLQDMDKPTKIIIPLILFVPFIGYFFLLIWAGIARGTKGSNPFGDDPHIKNTISAIPSKIYKDEKCSFCNIHMPIEDYQFVSAYRSYSRSSSHHYYSYSKIQDHHIYCCSKCKKKDKRKQLLIFILGILTFAILFVLVDYMNYLMLIEDDIFYVLFIFPILGYLYLLLIYNTYERCKSVAKKEALKETKSFYNPNLAILDKEHWDNLKIKPLSKLYDL